MDGRTERLNLFRRWIRLSCDISRGYTDCRRKRRNVFKDNGICTDLRVGTHSDATQNFGASPDINMSIQRRGCLSAIGAYRRLLEQQAVRSDPCVLVYYNPVRMRYQQAAADSAIDVDVCAADCTPKAVAQYSHFPNDHAVRVLASRMALIGSNAGEHRQTRVPRERSFVLPAPVRNIGRDMATTCWIYCCGRARRFYTYLCIRIHK